jgi:hypothetical protein
VNVRLAEVPRNLLKGEYCVMRAKRTVMLGTVLLDRNESKAEDLLGGVSETDGKEKDLRVERAGGD